MRTRDGSHPCVEVTRKAGRLITFDVKYSTRREGLIVAVAVAVAVIVGGSGVGGGGGARSVDSPRKGPFIKYIA